MEPYDKVWSYDYAANRWQDLTPAGSSAGSPAKRTLNGIAYDFDSQSLLMFGGTDALIDSENFVGREFGDTWSLTLDKDMRNDNLQSPTSVVMTSPLVTPIIIGVIAASVAVGLLFWKKRFIGSRVKR